MEKRINPKMFAKRLTQWQKEIESRVVEVMTQQNIKAISLLDNGIDYKSVDTIHTIIEQEDDGVMDAIVGLIYIDGKRLVMVPEDFIYVDMADKISEQGDVFSQEAWDSLDLTFDKDYLIEEVFSPTDTLMSIASTINEIIELSMEEKPLFDGEAIKIF